MQAAMKLAGFSAVEMVDGVVYARSKPELPECTAVPENGSWLLSFAWPFRAKTEQCAAWNAVHPDAPISIYLGETRMRMLIDATPASLRDCADMIDAMVAKCTEWRRATRQRDEGM